MQDILQWIEETIPQSVRASIESRIQANAALTNPLVKQLVALRAQLKENAYQKIFETRATVCDDMLKLTQSLTNLVHFSSVAGEDTSAYVNLLRNVSKVTQQLSFFGEDDENGDGIRDGVDEFDDLSLTPTDKKPLSIDEAKNPQAPSTETKPAETKPAAAPVNKDTGKTAEQEIDDASAEDPKGEGIEDAELDDDGEVKKSDDSADNGKNPLDSALDALNNIDDSSSEEGADDELGQEESDESSKEEKTEDSTDSKKPKSFLDQIDEESDQESDEESSDSEDADASSDESVTASDVVINKKTYRFAYLGLSPDKQKIRALVNDTIYIYSPSADLFGGDVVKLDLAMKKLVAKSAGYAAALTKINSLIRDEVLSVVSKKKLKLKAIRKGLTNAIDKGQLGEVHPKPGTPWKYRGVGIQKISNQEECIWFEAGSKEYSLIPNEKAMKGESLDDFSKGIESRLKTLSYDDGLKFIVGLVSRNVFKVIYVGYLG
jgi:hypothetical protein